MNRSSRWLVFLGFAALTGCGSSTDPDDGPIPLSKLPAAVIKAAQKKMPDVTFDAATKEKFAKQSAFGIRGKDKKGKSHQIKVSREGKVLESD